MCRGSIDVSVLRANDRRGSFTGASRGSFQSFCCRLERPVGATVTPSRRTPAGGGGRALGTPAGAPLGWGTGPLGWGTSPWVGGTNPWVGGADRAVAATMESERRRQARGALGPSPRRHVRPPTRRSLLTPPGRSPPLTASPPPALAFEAGHHAGACGTGSTLDGFRPGLKRFRDALTRVDSDCPWSDCYKIHPAGDAIVADGSEPLSRVGVSEETRALRRVSARRSASRRPSVAGAWSTWTMEAAMA
jgi:hypothetical protein